MVFFNATRHEHELFLVEGLSVYTCSRCKEDGANTGYKCKLSDSSSCKNFILHEACAILPDVFQHPFRRLFRFRPKTLLRHHCDACHDVLRGYVFERPDHLRLHPDINAHAVSLSFSFQIHECTSSISSSRQLCPLGSTTSIRCCYHPDRIEAATAPMLTARLSTSHSSMH